MTLFVVLAVGRPEALVLANFEVVVLVGFRVRKPFELPHAEFLDHLLSLFLHQGLELLLAVFVHPCQGALDLANCVVFVVIEDLID